MVTRRGGKLGQRVRTWDGQSWLLDPGALFLDFVYTGDFGVGPWREGIILSATQMDGWLEEHLGCRLKPMTAAEFRMAIELRDSLTRVVKAMVEEEGQPDSDDLSSTAWVAAQPDLPPVLPGYEPVEAPDANQALSTIARDAVIHLRDDRDRLRNCDGHDCPMVFLDLSRAGKRRWCAMARCGNRAKIHTFRAKHPEDQEQTKE